MNNIETAEQLAEIIETTGCDQRYSTMSDVCDAVSDALGDYADEHDVAAIAGETSPGTAPTTPKPMSNG